MADEIQVKEEVVRVVEGEVLEVLPIDLAIAGYVNQDLPAVTTGMTPVERVDANVQAARVANGPLEDQRLRRHEEAQRRLAEIGDIQEKAAKTIATGGSKGKGGGGKKAEEIEVKKVERREVIQSAPAPTPSLADEELQFMIGDYDLPDDGEDAEED